MKNYAWFTLIIPRYSLFYWIKTRLPSPQTCLNSPNLIPTETISRQQKTRLSASHLVCRRRDLNPHEIALTTPWTWRVCQFRHFGLICCGLNFISKTGFVNLYRLQHLCVIDVYQDGTKSSVQRLINIPCIYAMISNISTVRGYNFSNRTRLNRCIWRKERGPCLSLQFQSACSCSLP